MMKRNVRYLLMALLALALLLLLGAALAEINCQNCGESIPTYDVRGYEPIDDGYHYVTRGCPKCDYEYTVRTWHSKTYYPSKDSTCTVQGWERYWVCDTCGYEKKTMRALSPHTYLKSSYVYNNDATCYKDGTKTAKCIWYGENGCAATTTDTATGTKTPHDFTHATYTPVSEPTCTRNRRLIGYCAYYDGNYCKMSGIREEAGTALGHDYAGQEYLPYTAATCTQNATERAQCVRFGKDGCNSCDVRTLEDTATGHDLVHHEAKAATCTTAGWNAYQACSKCDYTTCVEIPAGHDLVHHEAKDATCTSIGWNAYDTCTRCDYTTFAELPAGHDLEHFERKRATCTEGGWNAHDTCKRCGYTTKKETNPLFHDMSEYVSDGNGKTHTRTCRREGCGVTDTRDCFGDRRASCVQQGACQGCGGAYFGPHTYSGMMHDANKHWRECADCHVLLSEAAHSFSHSAGDQNRVSEATCVSPALYHPVCDYCPYQAEDAFREGEIDPDNHDYVEEVVEPACTKDGYTRYTCTRCEHTCTANPVKKLCHWYGEWSSKGGDTHSASCRRKGCGHAAKVDCQRFEFPADDESLILCPVCGKVQNGERLERIAKATAKIVTGKRPKGELIVRTDGTFLSVAYEYAGKISEAAAQITITLPADALNGMKPVLVSLDGTETVLPFEAAGDKITFTLDFAEPEMPVFLIRLVPEA